MSFINDKQYSPDDGITFYDSTSHIHNANEVRPDFGEPLEFGNVQGQLPSVTISLQMPNNPTVAVRVWQIKVNGNVKLISLKIKKSVTGSPLTFDYLTVGEDNIVHLPVYEVDDDGFVDISEITVIPHSVDMNPSKYRFTVDLIGCGQTGKLHLWMLFQIILYLLFFILLNFIYIWLQFYQLPSHSQVQLVSLMT